MHSVNMYNLYLLIHNPKGAIQNTPLIGQCSTKSQVLTGKVSAWSDIYCDSKGISDRMYTYFQLLASVKRMANIMSDITEQRMMAHMQSVNLLLVMVRFQKAVLEKIKGETGKVNEITKLIPCHIKKKKSNYICYFI